MVEDSWTRFDVTPLILIFTPSDSFTLIQSFLDRVTEIRNCLAVFRQYV